MQKQNIIRNSFLTAVFFCFSASPALAWGDGIPGALVNQGIQKVREGITGTILGAVKAAAVTSIVNQVDRLVGGVGGGSPRMIRNYDDFLRQKPTLEAQTYVYNFLVNTYRGKGSTANYTGSTDSGLMGIKLILIFLFKLISFNCRCSFKPSLISSSL